MAKNNTYKPRNSIISFVALFFLLYFIVLPVAASILSGYFGSIDQVITDIVDAIPFGESCYWLAVKLMSAVHGQTLTGVQLTFTFLYVLEELTKALFTAIIFEAMDLLTSLLTGLKGDFSGIWNIAKKWLLNIFNALLAACLAPFLIGYIFSSMSSLGSIASGIISGLVSGILLLGGIAFFFFLYERSIVKALLYVVIKVLSLNTFRLFVSYVAVLCFLIGLQHNSFALMFGGLSGLAGLALILGGIDLMLDAAFK